MKKIRINSFAVLAFVVTFIFTTFNANANQTRENVLNADRLIAEFLKVCRGFLMLMHQENGQESMLISVEL